MSLSILILANLALADGPPPPPIVGGSETSGHESVGALVALDSSGNIAGAFCSGTLIGPRHVLTAAHCVDGLLDIRAMGYDDFEFVIGTHIFDSTGTWERASISSTESHPTWGSADTQGDIAILELGRSVETTSPALLSYDTPDSSWSDTQITYVGWGNTDDSEADTSGTKRTVDVPFYALYEDSILSYSDVGRNVCYGDSGGAAFVAGSDGAFRLAGVNSFIFNVDGGAPSCGEAGAAGGAARVDLYIDWIMDVMGEELPEEEIETETETEEEEPVEEDDVIYADADEEPSNSQSDVERESSEPTPRFEYDSADEQEAKSGCSVAASSPHMGLTLLALVGLVRRRR